MKIRYHIKDQISDKNGYMELTCIELWSCLVARIGHRLLEAFFHFRL